MAIMDDLQTRAKTQAHGPAQAPALEGAHARTLTVLNALAEGVHPSTGEVFPPDCPYHSPEIVRALYAAMRALEGGVPPRPAQPPDRSRPEAARAERREGSPANAGKPWSMEEDRQLLVEFDSGKTLKECAVLHQRTFAGIEARLEKLGRLDAADRTTSRRVPARPGNGVARTG
jgi:hypothetical protein